jgi:hypothetical protein
MPPTLIPAIVMFLQSRSLRENDHSAIIKAIKATVVKANRAMIIRSDVILNPGAI